MPIKLIIFDLDGTLVDSRDLHYQALNKALESVDPKYVISLNEHLSTYDGLSTTQKLNLLTSKKKLPKEDHDKVWAMKQRFTEDIVSGWVPDERICDILRTLRNDGYIVYIASNCTWRNLMLIALKKGFLEHVDWFISNEDVKHPKPSPQMYLQAMARANVSPTNTLIVEDSPIGKKAAKLSGAHLSSVLSPIDLSLFKIQDYIQRMSGDSVVTEFKWQKKCNVVIPMSGHGSRFAMAGYSFPKPLTDVRGMPMIQVVVRNLKLDPAFCRFVFIVQKEHYDKYDLENLLSRIAPGCKIIKVDGVTEGAACSAMLAKEYIDNEDPLILCNSDQHMVWDHNAFFHQMESPNIDGGIVCFKASHPKWSYAKLDNDGFVIEVAEKRVISEFGTTGLYLYRKGSDFVKYAEQMIQKNIRVNGEFYIAPIFNEAIADGKKIRIFQAQQMNSLGVPEDLEYFLANYKGDI